MTTSSQWTLLARILRPQGRKGEVLADLFTDFPERFASNPEVWVAEPGFSAAEGEKLAAPVPARIISHWLPVGRNAGRVVLQLAGVESISAAEGLGSREILVPAGERRPLEPGAAYISDLLGCSVFDGQVLVGTVEDVQFATTPDGTRRLEDAAPLLVVQTPGNTEALIPFAKQYLIELNLTARQIRMSLPEGLVHINEIHPTDYDTSD